MRVHIASDVHGAADELRSAADGSDLFICLGDLILFLDYDDPSRGIHADLFGRSFTEQYIELRTAGRFEDARELSAQAWASIGIVDPAQRWSVLETKVREQYAELFAAMPAPAFLTYGNVDVPALWPDYTRAGHQVFDGESVSVDGLRFGFVGGGLTSRMRTPYEISPEEYQAKVDQLGPVDVLFTHIPPAVPELLYDTVARRFEVGSSALVEYIRDVQPRYAFFGHVHQPFAARTRIGRTECINVGHFHGKGQPLRIDLE
jgi:Icc-related predicted phosphoesterase